MLTCPTHLPIYFCSQPVDFRKSFDGLTGVIASLFEISVLDGHLFLFINKRRHRIKAMWWDRDGLVLFYKRLEKGTFECRASPISERKSRSMPRSYRCCSAVSRWPQQSNDERDL